MTRQQRGCRFIVAYNAGTIVISRQEPKLMSQTRGRHSGPRDVRQHQPGQASKATYHRQNKPFAKTPSTRDATQTASIFKTRSFKLLVDAAGAENIALALDSNLTRVAELINGERFTPETAFHIETTLGLPDGFFDEPNPVLTPEIVARLRSPLDLIDRNVELEATYVEAPKPTAVAQINHHPSPTRHLPRESEMPKKTTGGSPRTAAKSNVTATTKSVVATSRKAAPAKGKVPSKAAVQQALPLNDVTTLEDIRRANLHVLTSRKRSKAPLAALMEISDANMANRFYGQKRMDDAEANRFTERLGLPTGWLDIPRSSADIPESVSDLLAPVPRRRGSVQQEIPPVAPKAIAANKRAGRNAETANARHAAPPDASDATVSAETNAGMGQQVPAFPLGTESAIEEFVSNDVPYFAIRQRSAPATSMQATAEPRSRTSATSLDDLQGIEPIAEALIKTLAGKARTGRLDELKALELLQQAVLL
jgi:hypothetical protein